MALSTTEFELLVFLCRHHGEVVTREQILSTVWGYEHDPGTNVVDVYVGYLRRKLARPDDPAPIVDRALGGLPPRQRRLRRVPVRALVERLAPRGLRWRLAGWFTLVMVLCTGIVFLAVYRGTGTQVRQQIDRELSGDAAEFAHNLRAAEPGVLPAQLEAAARELSPHPAVQRQLEAAVPHAHPGAADRHQQPRARHGRARPTTARSAAAQGPRTAWR